MAVLFSFGHCVINIEDCAVIVQCAINIEHCAINVEHCAVNIVHCGTVPLTGTLQCMMLMAQYITLSTVL